jgi:hypothetical protein
MRHRVDAVLLAGIAALAATGAADARPPAPPPLAFQTATLRRDLGTIDVRIQAVDDIGVVVRIARSGVRIGRQEAMVHSGRTLVPVRIGPRSMHRLRPGLHVLVLIYFGSQWPLRAMTPLLAPEPSAQAAAAPPPLRMRRAG